MKTFAAVLLMALACAAEEGVWQAKFVIDTKGAESEFVIEVHPDWSPLGAARFREIVEQRVWDEARFFRVVAGFVVQWGIPGEPDVAKEWREKKIKDDPMVSGVSNLRGFVSFAKAGPHTRTTQVFINFRDNTNLDGMGFSPFGKVVSGMDAVDAINDEYSQNPNQGSIQAEGNGYLKPNFPNMSFIKSVTIVDGAEL